MKRLIPYHIKQFCILFFISFIFVSCSILPKEEYRKVKYYDLGKPENYVFEDRIVNIRRISSPSTMKYKMLYRKNEYELLVDEYNRWADTPASMVKNYFSASFDSSGENSENELFFDGKLVCFDIDLDKNEVVVLLKYKIKQKGNITNSFSGESRVVESFKKQSPESFARALSKAVQKILKDVKDSCSAFPFKK